MFLSFSNARETSLKTLFLISCNSLTKIASFNCIIVVNKDKMLLNILVNYQIKLKH